MKNGLGNGDSWDGEKVLVLGPRKGKLAGLFRKEMQSIGARSVEDFDLGKTYISSIYREDCCLSD